MSTRTYGVVAEDHSAERLHKEFGLRCGSRGEVAEPFVLVDFVVVGRDEERSRAGDEHQLEHLNARLVELLRARRRHRLRDP